MAYQPALGRHKLLATGLGLALTLSPVLAEETVEISYEKFVLDNGLTLIVHEDRKAPIVAVNVWYHVGSKDEKLGKTGFAHLFEHLMFNGTENYNDEYFKPFEQVGATDMNGTTNSDRTNYFQNVPTTALDMALWMESDRMGHLMGAVDQAKLDEQRDVVKNEKRQGENQPYGQWFNIVSDATYPEGHPYSWTTIGSMEDLSAASMEDVQEWFKTYYGAANATIVVAGDVDAQTAKEKVEKYFGDIPSGPPLIKPKEWIAKRTGEQRRVAYDRVPQSRVSMVWNVPYAGHKDAMTLDLASEVLGSGKNSRLYKRLVYQDQIATGVTVWNWNRELSGWFVIQADVKPGVEAAVVERALNEELARFLEDGPTKDEMERVKTGLRAGLIRGMERIGGFGGKSDILARNQVFHDDPEFYKKQMEHWQAVSRKQVRKVANEWLSDGKFVLEYHPFPQYQHAQKGVDRSKGVPVVNEMPKLDFPKMERAQLDNGLKIIVAERHTVPVVSMEMQFDAGYAADQNAKLGTSGFALSMLDEGTDDLDALEISAKAEELGALIGTNSTLDTSEVTLSALKENLEESLELYADVILNPSFPKDEIERLRTRWLANIQQEKSQPQSMALRTLPPLLYGDGHAYSIPFTGSGTEESIKSLEQKDLVNFHKTWLRPDNATLIIVGDTTMKEILPKVKEQFSGWRAAGELPKKNITTVEKPEKTQVYLIDKPGATQSIVIAGHIAPSGTDPDSIAIDTMNTILGGSFTSRLNMNLREDKGWSYGARSILMGAKGQRPLFAYAPVQTDKTKESVEEIVKEVSGYRNDSPATQEELEKVIANKTRKLPGQYETANAVLNAISNIVRYNRPDDYVLSYKGTVEALKLGGIRQLARTILSPEQFTWVIVGDLEQIESGIRELNLGEVTVIDADGAVVPRAND